jgi:adenylosuccinate synthase
MAGLDPTLADDYHVWVVLRRFPIRVAGPSGELRGETSWEELGLPAEKTTVTKKVRRVGEWDPKLARDAVRANGGPAIVRIAYTMVDQCRPEVANVDGHLNDGLPYEVVSALSGESHRVYDSTGIRPSLFGTGPNSMVEAF